METKKGGGPTPNRATNICRGIIDLTAFPDTTITDVEHVTYPAFTTERGVMQIATNMNQKSHWQPIRSLPVRRGEHPIELLFNPTLFRAIHLATQQDPEDVVAYVTTLREQHVTSNCIRELMSHGEMTKDTILNTFLYILCSNQGLKFLSTYFLHILKRDRSWTELTSWFAPSSDLQNNSYPLLNSEQLVLIPCHLNGNHWVGVVF